uniref:Uncharacterized protein n=1 Tax=Romanomermis culicivorax TaxID=13658 RepID=A0A915HWX1_ROMCU
MLITDGIGNKVEPIKEIKIMVFEKHYFTVAELFEELNAKTGAAIAGTIIEIMFSYDENGRGLVNLKIKSDTSLHKINISNCLMELLGFSATNTAVDATADDFLNR